MCVWRLRPRPTVPTVSPEIHHDLCDHNSPKLATVGNLAGYGLACQPKLQSSVGWSGRWESNPRHSAWEADVLPLNYARAIAQNSEARCRAARARTARVALIYNAARIDQLHKGLVNAVG